MRLSVDSLGKEFPGERVLTDVSFEVADGEFFVVVGPSGCGKSTLLKCLAGLHTPEEGSIRFDGEDVTSAPVAERDVGFVFQDFEDRLFPHRTVAENVSFGLRHGGVDDGAAIDERVDAALEVLAIPETRNQVPGNLSGGQQQRVELARHLVRDCGTLLLDDPLSDLDYKLQKEMEINLRRRHDAAGTTYVYVTHNQDQADEWRGNCSGAGYPPVDSHGTDPSAR